MEVAELRAALEEVRKIFGFFTDAAVWADLFHRDASGKVHPNAQHLPGYVKTRQHVAKFMEVMDEVEKVDSHARTALLVHWIPTLHYIQNDDLIVSVSAAACISMDAARDTMLHISRMVDPTPSLGGGRDQILARINAGRSAEADSLNLIKPRPEMYGQYYVDQVKGVIFKSGAEFVHFAKDNWPTIQATISNRVAAINAAIDRPAGPVNLATGKPDDRGGLLARSLDFKAQMAAKLAASKR